MDSHGDDQNRSRLLLSTGWCKCQSFCYRFHFWISGHTTDKCFYGVERPVGQASTLLPSPFEQTCKNLFQFKQLENKEEEFHKGKLTELSLEIQCFYQKLSSFLDNLSIKIVHLLCWFWVHFLTFTWKFCHYHSSTRSKGANSCCPQSSVRPLRSVEGSLRIMGVRSIAPNWDSFSVATYDVSVWSKQNKKNKNYLSGQVRSNEMTHKGRVREGNTVTHLVRGNDHYCSFYLYIFLVNYGFPV